jgi:hypothetical protein
MSQTVDVSGLSPEAVRAVEKFVASLRERHQGPPLGNAEAGEGGDRWDAAAEAVKGLTDYDFGAWAGQRAFDRQHGQDQTMR